MGRALYGGGEPGARLESLASWREADQKELIEQLTQLAQNCPYFILFYFERQRACVSKRRHRERERERESLKQVPRSA